MYMAFPSEDQLTSSPVGLARFSCSCSFSTAAAQAVVERAARIQANFMVKTVGKTLGLGLLDTKNE